MSISTPQIHSHRLRRLIVATCTFLVCLLISNSAFANQPRISIERTLNSIQGQFEYVDINFEPDGSNIAFNGFDLLITYDQAALNFFSAASGDLLTSCGWQYFTYTTNVNIDCQGPCPSGVLRIVAIADDPAVSGQPNCALGATGGKLAVMKFLVSNNALYECADVNIRFFWNDCGDNALSSMIGDSLFAADTVFYFTQPNQFFPTPTLLGADEGLPDSCLAGGVPGSVTRGVNFHHGGVSIVCPNPVANRGDINLNGLAYEVSDAVLFIDYFFQGLAVFTISATDQVAATDINADGAVLQFNDLIYLLRIIAGDAVPYPKPAAVDSLSALFVQNTVSHYVRVDSPHALAGAILDFSGLITPTFTAAAPGDFVKEYGHSGGNTRVLIAGTHPATGPGTVWFSYSGEGTLTGVQTADFAESPIETQIAFETAPPDCGDANGDSHINISDAVALINYIFSITPLYVDPWTADADCNQLLTISDAVYLLNYIFAQGPAPCANCL